MNNKIISVLAAVSLFAPVSAMAAGIATQQQAKDAAVKYMVHDNSGINFPKSKTEASSLVKKIASAGPLEYGCRNVKLTNKDPQWSVTIVGPGYGGDLTFSAKTGKLVDRCFSGED